MPDFKYIYMEGTEAGRGGHLDPEDQPFMGLESSYYGREEIRSDGAIVRADGSILRTDFARKVEEVMGEDY